MFDDLEMRQINKNELDILRVFLNKFGLKYEDDIEFTLGIFKKEGLIATASFAGNIIKCVAIDDNYQGTGLTSRLISGIMKKEHEFGRSHLFIFSKPENVFLFERSGFKEIERVNDWFALLETGTYSIERYLESIKDELSPGMNGAVVVNCNPFTKGHRCLIEKASGLVDDLYVFIVEEDLSVFPFNVRYSLVKEGISDISNVHVLKGGPYIISRSTFPRYFLKNESETDILNAQITLDIRIFATYIAPALNIKKRFIGTEPYCNTTKNYNDTMKRVLPEYGIESYEIERKKLKGLFISASEVRKYLRSGDMGSVKDLVCDNVYQFLISDEAKVIIDKLKKRDERH